ncbi:hypothetical protein [Paenibacillus sp. J2TS4]|uniref:hypothetical protein n=1 Tax=Paenibacillus sp. J2TS4 TaxID=2807194 RepID=UPI001BCA92A8|nr:hypothetical protein [Paenibacillus sp. J2TS4]
MKALKYVIVYFIILQFVVPLLVPSHEVYHNRIDYELTKSNLHDIDAVLDQIKRQISRNKSDNYIILLGDSVIYGSPGNSDQPVNVYMEQLARQTYGNEAPAIYNLSMPAMQLGDIYTMLLKLDEHKISTDRVIFNIRYASFVERTPWPPAVFWLKDELRKLDPETFAHIRPQLEATGYTGPEGLYERYKHLLHEDLLPKVSMFRYKDFIIKSVKHAYSKARGIPIPDDALGDPRPWFEKEGLEQYLKSDEIANSYSDMSFDLSEESPDVFFLNQIANHQQGTDTMIVLTGVNQQLMKDYVQKEGYKQNMSRIDRMMESFPFPYINLEGKIDDALFTDHTHFTAEGHEALGSLLWNAYIK